MPEGTCPPFNLKLLIRVARCFRRRPAARFLRESSNSSRKPVDGRDCLSAKGLEFCRRALPRRRGGRSALGLSLRRVCAIGNLGRQEGKVFNCRSTPTPSLFQSGVKKCCGIRLGAPRRVRLRCAPRIPGSRPLPCGTAAGPTARSRAEAGGSFPGVWAQGRDAGPRGKAQPGGSWLWVAAFLQLRAGLVLPLRSALRRQRLLAPRALRTAARDLPAERPLSSPQCSESILKNK